MINFLPDPTSLSIVRMTMLAMMLIGYVEHPFYQWPQDYLTAKPYCKSSNCELNACTASEKNILPKFDYIIVGSGPAGSTIAHRLVKQFPSRTVLLIERGAEPSVESITPKFWAFNLNTTAMYNYFAESSVNYSNAFKHGTECMVGKQIGGSTGANAMMYLCGTDKNYNNWAAKVGDPSWNYEQMLQLIKKNQNMKDPELLKGKCAAYHGTSGPLIVTTNSYDLNEDGLLKILKLAAKEKGVKELTEINCGPPYTGLVHVQSTVSDGERNSAARAFLVPIKDYPNFYYIKESMVDKVYLKKERSKLYVTGVSVLTKQSQCTKMTLTAKREVILSAGTYGSPQILLRSGIGRENELKMCDTRQLKDLPVGHHLSDHFMTIHVFTMPGGLTSSFFGAAGFFLYQARRFATAHDGYFTSSGFNNHLFVNTKDSNSSYPDIQIVFGVLDQNSPDVDVFMRDKFGFKNEFADQLIAANQQNTLILPVITLLQPKSRGQVKLRSCSDPYAAPIINANYLAEQEDFDTVLRGIAIVNDFMSSKAIKEAGIKQMDLKIPECDVNARNSDSYNRCYIKYFSRNLWHPTGTCRMGFSSADNVVDYKLRVFGVGKTDEFPMLRVADASIMPTITSGNTQCPVYAIGEKAAKTIIDDNY